MSIVRITILLTVLSGGAAHAQDAPRFFAPGVVTIPEATTYRPTFSPDGRTAIYSMEVSGGYVLVETRMRGGRWGPPEVLPFSGRHSDAEGVLSPDGSRFVFASQRPREGATPRSDYDLWEVARDPSGRWGTPRLMETLATTAHELYPSLTSDGTLYFTRSSPDGSDLWRAAAAGAGYAAPEPVREVNTDRRESGVFVNAAGTLLLFASNREGTLGGIDLFVSCREGGAWGAARPLPAPINSADQESSPTLSPDGKTLYFTSNRRSPHAARLGGGARYGDLLRRLRQPGNGLWHTYQIATPALCHSAP
jgi:Tol biopolymer transport system component